MSLISDIRQGFVSRTDELIDRLEKVGLNKALYKVFSNITGHYAFANLAPANIGLIKLIRPTTYFDTYERALRSVKAVYVGTAFVGATSEVIKAGQTLNTANESGRTGTELRNARVSFTTKLFKVVSSYSDAIRFVHKNIHSFPILTQISNKMGSWQVGSVRPFSLPILESMKEDPRYVVSLFIPSLIELGNSAYTYFSPESTAEDRKKVINLEGSMRILGNLLTVGMVALARFANTIPYEVVHNIVRVNVLTQHIIKKP